MTLSERHQVYVEHMLECIERVERFVGQDRNLFMQSDLVQDVWCVTCRLCPNPANGCPRSKNTQAGNLLALLTALKKDFS